MFEYFKKRKKQEVKQENEFSFIWFKQIDSGDGTTYYTKPFRTKVKAKDIDEARQKVEDFALRKMKLVIVEESKYDQTDLSGFQKSFDKISAEMDKVFKKMNDVFNNKK